LRGVGGESGEGQAGAAVRLPFREEGAGAEAFIYAASVTLADAAARAEGWRACGRAMWERQDGATVYLLSLFEQLVAVGAGQTVYVVGRQRGLVGQLRRARAVVVRLAE
jgi:hypothetical protein